MDVLLTTEGLIQRSWVTLFRYGLTVRATSSGAVRNFLIETMRAFKRTGGPEKFPTELGVMKKHFNDVLARHCVKQRRLACA